MAARARAGPDQVDRVFAPHALGGADFTLAPNRVRARIAFETYAARVQPLNLQQ